MFKLCVKMFYIVWEKNENDNNMRSKAVVIIKDIVREVVGVFNGDFKDRRGVCTMIE